MQRAELVEVKRQVDKRVRLENERRPRLWRQRKAEQVLPPSLRFTFHRPPLPCSDSAVRGVAHDLHFDLIFPLPELDGQI